MIGNKSHPIEIIDDEVQAIPSTRQSSLSSPLLPTRTGNNLSANDVQEEIPVEELFRVNSKIVGKRFYNEKLNDKEIIYLLREPNNPYDRQAIKVLSRNKLQVGHISAGSSYPNMANCLSILMDNKLAHGAGAMLEACSVSGKNNSYQSMCQITVVGQPAHKQVILQHLQKCQVGCLDVQTGQVYGSYSPLIDPALAQLVASAGIQGPAEYQRLSQDEVIRELDHIWDQQEVDLEALTFDASLYPEFIRCFASELFPHQRKGLAWMLDRELVKRLQLPPFYEQAGTRYVHALTRHNYNDKPSAIQGGILADTMGLGKSLTTLCLILCNPPVGHSFGECAMEAASEVVPTKKPRASSKKTAGPCDDISEPPQKKPKKAPKALASGPTLPAARGTLIVCPLSVVSSWVDEIALHLVEASVTYVVYHGPNRHLLAASLAAADIVITTYDVVASECGDVDEAVDASSAATRRTGGPLHSLQWWRVVLDEAHIIRTMQTLRFKACLNLDSVFRWVLTGTLIINTVADLEAPLRFLQLDPFSSDSTLFKRLLVRPIKNGSVDALVKLRTLLKSLAIRRDKNNLIGCTLPPKIETIVRVQLPPAERTAYDAIAAAVADFNSYLQRSNSGDNADGGSRGSAQSILAMITRLRQCCLDLRLVPPTALVELLAEVQTTGSGKTARLTETEKKELATRLQSLVSAAVRGKELTQNPSTEIASAAAASAGDGEDEGMECAICFDPMLLENSNIFRICRHMLCESCTNRLFQKVASAPCPLCRTMTGRSDCLSYLELQQSLSGNDAKPKPAALASAEDANYRSGKTTEILRALLATKASAPDEKTVIFSSFVSYLDKLRPVLEQNGFKVTQVDGRCNQATRAAEIRRFTLDDSSSVMLCSLKAAGVGITLTRANNIYLTDLWWAPSIDLQAIDRVHRMGQTRTVQVLRFMVANSIDEKIYELQKHKLEMSRLTLERGVGTEERLRGLQTLLS